MRLGALTGGVCVALLLALTATNLYSFAQVELEQNCDYTICVRSRGIGTNASENRHAVVAGRYGLFHRLAAKIPGATLTIPPWMEEHRWHLERLARLRVIVADAPLVLTPEQVREIRTSTTDQYRFLRRRKGKGQKAIWQKIRMLLDDPRGDYVIAQTTDEYGELFMVPAGLYAEVTRR